VTRALAIAVALVLAAAAAPAAAQHAHGGPPSHGAGTGTGTQVEIGYAAFDPPQLDVLRGDAITWDNVGVRRHDVAAVDASFVSGILGAGATFTRTFTAPGPVAYFCTIHPFMRGSVAVHDLLLDAPSQTAVPGRPFPVGGRTALAPGTPITVEADEGRGFAAVAEASAGPDGTFATDLRPHAPARLRAVSGGAVSPEVGLLVLDRKLRASVRRSRGRSDVRVRVTPPGRGTVALQLRLRERFGWWPVRRAALDARGRARFVLATPRRVRARVVLTLEDGATLLAVSAPLRLGR
jgi:plastocyanin